MDINAAVVGLGSNLKISNKELFQIDKIVWGSEVREKGTWRLNGKGLIN